MVANRQLIKRRLAGLTLWVAIAVFGSLLPDASWQTTVIIALVSLPLFLYVTKYINLRLALFLTAALGLSCAGYLATIWYTSGVPQCSSDGCAVAQSSSYAKLFFGIPTSTVGVVGYSLVLLALLLPLETRVWAVAGLAAFGLAVSIFLTYSSIFVLHTTCQWCLGSATAMTSLAWLSWQQINNVLFSTRSSTA